jgi:hypothetical protein
MSNIIETAPDEDGNLLVWREHLLPDPRLIFARRNIWWKSLLAIPSLILWLPRLLIESLAWPIVREAGLATGAVLYVLLRFIKCVSEIGLKFALLIVCCVGLSLTGLATGADRVEIVPSADALLGKEGE